MGLKAQDIVPFSTLGPTALTPSNKDLNCKVFSVLRTDTASTLKAVLPAGSSVLSITRTGNTNSDAATTATVTLSMSDNSGTISSGTAVDVKTAGTTAGYVQMTNLPNIEPVPATGDVKVSAVYAETGGASTTGGPWYFIVTYVR